MPPGSPAMEQQQPDLEDSCSSQQEKELNITETIQKPSKHSSLGILFRGKDPNIEISNIQVGSIASKTRLEHGMILRRINGQSFQDAKDAATFLREAEGTIKIEVYGTTLVVNIKKPTTATSLGIVLKGESPPVEVSSIVHGSLADKTNLKSGYQIISIDEQTFTNAFQATNYLKDASNCVTIVARRCCAPPSSTSSEQCPRQADYKKPPPPGLPYGGVWEVRKYSGPQTAIGVVAGCCFCGIGGFLALLCPCDERFVYIVNGRSYTETGKLVGQDRPGGEPELTSGAH